MRRTPPRPKAPAPAPTPGGALSPGALKFLQKLSKAGKGTLKLAELVELAPRMGWDVQRLTMPRPGMSEPVHRALGLALEPGARITSASTYGPTWDRPTVVAVSNDRKAREDYDLGAAAEAQIGASLLTVGKLLPPKKGLPPDTLGPDDRAIWLRDLRRSEWGVGTVEVNVWSAWPGFRVNAPGLPSTTVWVEANRRGEELPDVTAASFWTWAYKKAGAQERAVALLASLGSEGALPKPGDHHPDGDENTGICQICERRQKLRMGYIPGLPSLVPHGYRHEATVFGHSSYGTLGQRVGNCFGVDAAPWELDSSRLRLYHEGLVQQAAGLRRDLADLRAGRVTELNGKVRDPQRHRMSYSDQFVTMTLTPASTVWPSGIRSWSELVKKRIDALDGHLEQLVAYTASVGKRLASWKRQPLFDEMHPPSR